MDISDITQNIVINMKKTGNILLLFLIIGSYFSFKQILSIEAQITDMKGNKIDKIKVFESFMLVIDDTTNINFDHINIEGLEKFIISENRRTNNSNNNKYYFVLMARSEGEYPITITNPKTNSDIKLDIKVTETKIKFDILLDIKKPQEIFAGQKVNMVLRFSYEEDKSIRFAEKIIPAQIENLIFKIDRNIKMYQEKKYINKNDKIYNIIEIYGSLCPKKAGEFIIENFFGIFQRSTYFSFFNTTKIEDIANEIIKLNVKELPDEARNVDMVGKFSDFSINIEKNNIKEEEPVLLTLSITGDTNFDMLNRLNLNIPDSINVFEPKINLIKKANQETKKFEYIIQPKESGIIEIPSQDFYYFDPDNELVQKLSTEKIILQVEKANKNNIQNNIDKTIKDTDNKSNNSDNLSDQDYIKNLIEKNSNPTYIPWSIFFMLLMLPAGILANLKKSILYRFYNNKIKYNLFRSFILNKAIKNIDQAHKAGKSSLLYSIVKNALISYILKQDAQDNRNISNQEIIDILMQNNIDNNINNIIEEYKILSQELLSYTKYHFIKTEDSSSDIFQKSKDFIISIKNNKSFKNINSKNNKYILIILILNCFNICSANNIQDNKLKNLADLYKARKYACTFDKLKINNIINNINNINNNIDKNININNIINLIPLIAWQIIFCVLWAILVISLSDPRKYLFMKLIISILLIISGSSIVLIAHERNKLIALVKEENSKLYLGPDEKYPTKINLQKFDLAEIIKKQDFAHASWYYIKTKSGQGWAKSEDLKLIKDE